MLELNLLRSNLVSNDSPQTIFNKSFGLGIITGVIILTLWNILLSRQLHITFKRYKTQQNIIKNATNTINQTHKNYTSQLYTLEKLSREKLQASVLLLHLNNIPNDLYLTDIQKIGSQWTLQGKARDLTTMNTLLQSLTKLSQPTTATISKNVQEPKTYHDFTINLTFKN